MFPGLDRAFLVPDIFTEERWTLIYALHVIMLVKIFCLVIFCPRLKIINFYNIGRYFILQ